MKLHDAVKFTRSDELQATQWQDLTGLVALDLSDACLDSASNVLTDADGDCRHEGRPVILRAELVLSSRDVPDDGDTWLTRVAEAALDYAVARALISQPPASAYQTGAVWIGATTVNHIAFVGNPIVSPGSENVAQSILQARTLWFRNAVRESPDDGPILHISPVLSAALKRVGLIDGKGDDMTTILGDPVVANEGYDPVSGQPKAFWTPQFEVLYGDAEGIGMVRQASVNTTRMLTTLPFVIRLNPSTIVRVDISAT